MHRVGNFRKGPPGWIRAEPKAICNALGTAGTQKGTMGGEVTHPGARDEVREFSHSPVQNGLLNTLHIEEQRDVHAAGMREGCADLDNPTDTQLETD